MILVYYLNGPDCKLSPVGTLPQGECCGRGFYNSSLSRACFVLLECSLRAVSYSTVINVGVTILDPSTEIARIQRTMNNL